MDNPNLASPPTIQSVLSLFGRLWPRIVGLLIVFKVMIPLLILLVLLVGSWKIIGGINTEIERAGRALEPKIELAKDEIKKIREEGRRIADEIVKIKNQGGEAAEEIKRSIEPIRQSLYAISGTVGAISKTLESILNGMIKIINRIPGVKDMQRINLPDINVPGFHLPDIDIDVDLTFNMAAVEALKAATEQIATEAESMLNTIVKIWTAWWWTVTTIFYLIGFWILLALAGNVARSWHKFLIGTRLLMGRSQDASLQML